MPAAPATIFFDAAGTLIHLQKSVGETYREVALDFGAHPEAAALDKAFRAAWKAAPARVATSGPRPDDDKGWWRDLVRRVFADVLDAAQLQNFDFAAYFERLYARFAEPGVWLAYPEVGQVLTALRDAGHRLGVISNFDRRLRTVFENLALTPFFEHLVISSEVGVDKPDPAIYQHALQVFGVTPADAIHVGDDPHKDWGADAVGLRVFRLERPAMTLRDLPPWLDGSIR